MVSRTTTTTLLLLALALAATPAHAEGETESAAPADEIVDLPDGGWPNCNVAYVTASFPFVELHPECLV